MPRMEVGVDLSLLSQVVRDPHRLGSLSPQEFSRVLDAAERARLIGWLLTQIETDQISGERPDWLNDRVLTVRARATEYVRGVRWEIDRIRRAFWQRVIPWILLKGAAYIAMKLPPGRGRRVADIDILVPREHLDDAEAALQQHGWTFAALNPYDTRYYRQWMHELPPMIHGERRSVVDLHHAILPRTSRLHPSTARLIERSVEIEDDLRVLSPAHMVLHAAAHLFHDGEIAGAVRDLVDLDGLLRYFGEDRAFWTDFVGEARELELTRPAHYALRYTARLLRTPIPPDVLSETRRWAPAAPAQGLMDALVERVILGMGTSSAAAYALYVRSHWLRMPPWLLARHLLQKSLRAQ